MTYQEILARVDHTLLAQTARHMGGDPQALRRRHVLSYGFGVHTALFHKESPGLCGKSDEDLHGDRLSKR